MTRKGPMMFMTLNISIEIRYALVHVIVMSLCSKVIATPNQI